MPFLATINVPGYLPMDDEPPVFDTAREAWEYLADERRHSEDDAHWDYPDFQTDYSGTVADLNRRARWAGSGLVCDFEAVGTVYGPTPGYVGLGLVYSVTEVEQ